MRFKELTYGELRAGLGKRLTDLSGYYDKIEVDKYLKEVKG